MKFLIKLMGWVAVPKNVRLAWFYAQKGYAIAKKVSRITPTMKDDIVIDKIDKAIKKIKKTF